MRKIVFILILLSIACKREINDKNPYEEYIGIQLTVSESESRENNIKYSLEFPDTVRVNQPYKAVLEFESDFDTIAEPMISDSIKFRVITFNYFDPIKIGVSNKNRELDPKETIKIPNKKFILGNVKFEEKGDFLFLALLEDEMMYNFYNSEGKRDSVHFDRKFEEIKKKVVVID